MQKKREFFLWSRRVLVSPVVQGAVMSKMMGRTDLILSEAIHHKRLPPVGVFPPKRVEKGIFNGKSGNFLCGVLVFLFRRAFGVM